MVVSTIQYTCYSRGQYDLQIIIPYTTSANGIITWLPNPVGMCVSLVGFIFFVFLSVKSCLSASGVFVHRAFCAYFLGIERLMGNA